MGGGFHFMEPKFAYRAMRYTQQHGREISTEVKTFDGPPLNKVRDERRITFMLEHVCFRTV
jgi:hypothetical protein